jgi:hypothetical protein
MSKAESVVHENLFLVDKLGIVKAAAKDAKIAVPEVIFLEGQIYSKDNLDLVVPPKTIWVRTLATHRQNTKFWTKYDKLSKKQDKAEREKIAPKPPRLVSGHMGFLTDLH